jgi:hypothetical protein
MSQRAGAESGQRQARPATLRKIIHALEKMPKLLKIYGL